MKATITRLDGTKIEAEGTPEEIAKLVGLPAAPSYTYTFVPCTRPHADEWLRWPQVGLSWITYSTGHLTVGSGWAHNNAAAGRPPLSHLAVPSDPVAMAYS